ncbi:MAG: hypothetical protein ACHQKZ_05430 [Solirubrobacterales bacterium]
MVKGRTRMVVAFDASGVSGGVLARSWRGFRLRAFARIGLPPGALTPSAVAPNLRRPDSVGEALEALRRRLGGSSADATLVLPDGVAWIALLDTPSDTDLRAFVRFRLAPSLPYPADEAIIDALVLGPARALGAAVRRSVVAEYEEAASAAGFTRHRVDLAPLMAVSGVLRRGTGVHVILGDAALSLAAFQGSRLAAFRTRWRDPGPGEALRLVEEAERTALLAGGEGIVTFAGVGAAGLVEELVATGRSARLAVAASGPPEAAEAAWLGGALA